MPHRLLNRALSQKGTLEKRNQNKSQSVKRRKLRKIRKFIKTSKSVKNFQNVFDDCNWCYCMQ